MTSLEVGALKPGLSAPWGVSENTRGDSHVRKTSLTLLKSLISASSTVVFTTEHREHITVVVRRGQTCEQLRRAFTVAVVTPSSSEDLPQVPESLNHSQEKCSDYTSITSVILSFRSPWSPSHHHQHPLPSPVWPGPAPLRPPAVQRTRPTPAVQRRTPSDPPPPPGWETPHLYHQCTHTHSFVFQTFVGKLDINVTNVLGSLISPFVLFLSVQQSVLSLTCIFPVWRGPSGCRGFVDDALPSHLCISAATSSTAQRCGGRSGGDPMCTWSPAPTTGATIWNTPWYTNTSWTCLTLCDFILFAILKLKLQN